MEGNGKYSYWKRAVDSAVFAVLMALPPLGVWLSGRPVTEYMEFPPLTRYVEHAGFSTPLFAALAAVIAAVVSPFVFKVVRANLGGRVRSGSDGCGRGGKAGWMLLSAGIAISAAAWVVAWGRFAVFADFQPYTFTPLWIGYILAVNGIAQIRSGRCVMLSTPGVFAGLFAASAVFWWFFEYLNRFVQNWYYVGIDDFGPWEYFLYATLPFSTVLPAVLGTYEALMTFPRLGAGLDDSVRIRVPRSRLAAVLALAVSAAGLALIGVLPDYLFPLLWVSPLGILVASRSLRGERTVLSDVVSGNWRRVALLALSGLVCGFFWELWNYHSLAKWVYAVPFVGDFKIFEMPVLGYAGYLPFGLECAVVAEMYTGWRAL